MSSVETFGESLPGLLLDCVVNSNNPNQLALHTWNGRRAATVGSVEHAGVNYVAANLSNSPARSVRFPPPSTSFGSTVKLISTLREFLWTYGHLEPVVVALLVAFGLASWFCDVFSLAPVLYALGPASAVTHSMRLVACFCRRPLLLAEIDYGGLAALPSGLGATFLVNERDLPRRIQHTLLASTRPNFCVIRGKQRLDIFGARAFASDDFPKDGIGLVISIPPAQKSLPILTREQEEQWARNLQAQMLRYRMVHREKSPWRHD